jgi:hypothetical protein
VKTTTTATITTPTIKIKFYGNKTIVFFYKNIIHK